MVHLVEIDLLPQAPAARGTARTVHTPSSSAGPRIAPGPTSGRSACGTPLPIVPVPLRVGDGDACLDLRAILDRVYDESGYPFYLYEREPDPPLAGDDAAWARTLLSQSLERS